MRFLTVSWPEHVWGDVNRERKDIFYTQQLHLERERVEVMGARRIVGPETDSGLRVYRISLANNSFEYKD